MAPPASSSSEALANEIATKIATEKDTALSRDQALGGTQNLELGKS